MIDLGRKPVDYEKLYPSMTEGKEDKNKKIYTRMTIPLSIIGDKKVKKGDKIKFCISGEVTGIRQDDYSDDLIVEAKEGELESGGESAEAEGEGTVLG